MQLVQSGSDTGNDTGSDPGPVPGSVTLNKNRKPKPKQVVVEVIA
jgi:hypothetical protein